MIFHRLLMRNSQDSVILQIFLIAILIGAVSGCNLASNSGAETPLSGTQVTAAESTLPAEPSLWSDASAVVAGICFESAYDAAGQVFVLRSASELTRFFDLADNSRLCRHPVERPAFDFSDGRVLAGLWSRGRGCVAGHQLIAFIRDETARTINIHLRLIVEGACPYDLVRPYWVGLPDAQDYTITITVQ